MTKNNVIIQTIYSGPVGPFLPDSGFSNEPSSKNDFIPTPVLRPELFIPTPVLKPTNKP